MTAAIHTSDGHDEAYGSRPTRRRRTAAEMLSVEETIFDVCKRLQPMTVRQVYYQLVTLGVIDKTENAYKATVRALTAMRRGGRLPYGWIADNTRWMRKPNTHNSLSDALEDTQAFYRRDIWNEQNAYVEIWLEKDALSGVLLPITSKWHVPLMVTRGYPSLSFVHAAGEAIEAVGKPTHIYYLGDHDPSGLDISRHVEESLVAYNADVSFTRIAVTEWQIREYSLPTRPTKKTDTRSKNFDGESVEVDALPPDYLRELVEGFITDHIDDDTLDRTLTIESAEKETLGNILGAFRNGDFGEAAG